jgi:hypothetical protein
MPGSAESGGVGGERDRRRAGSVRTVFVVFSHLHFVRVSFVQQVSTIQAFLAARPRALIPEARENR